ncbi:MAG: pantetheine-phosphate adenylyltransferase [Chloroflexi bacterium]|nr:pantetheine-phosphate adenylyltransferase [Chloroflexota bacterium]
MIRALYPGTFDPIHNGHIDIATRAAHLFDELVIAVYDSPPKTLFFDTAQRVGLARAALAHLPNVWVAPYRGLTVSFAREVGAAVMVRGLRAISDFEFEFQMALTNKKLAPDIEFVCLMTSLEHAYLSSTILKEVAALGGDIAELAPVGVQAALHARFVELGPEKAQLAKMNTSRD